MTTNRPTPQRDVFTLICTVPASERNNGREIVHVHDFTACSDAIRNAAAYTRKHPRHMAEVWVNRDTLIWQASASLAPPCEQWSGPAAVGTYAVHFPDAGLYCEPSYRLLTRGAVIAQMDRTPAHTS